MADTPSGFAGAASNIRETAKWLLAAFAAIGVVLISGVQFSGVAKLKSPQLEQALGLGALGLLGLGWAIAGVANLLLPRSYTLGQLIGGATRHERAIRKALNARPELLGGATDVASLDSKLTEAIRDHTLALAAWAAAADDQKQALERVLKTKEASLDYVSAVTANAGDWANYLGLRKDYTSAFRWRILPGVVVAVVAFAGVLLLTADVGTPKSLSLSKAIVPSGGSFVKARLAGSDLSGATMSEVDFSGADLTDADMSKGTFSKSTFTSANLRGANLTGAALDDVIWAPTTCPDGENSDAVGNSCQAHLTVPAGAASP
jgi:hypothetical protein